MKTLKPRASAIATACLALAVLTQPALARSADREITVTIYRGDLDLSTEPGVRKAMRRIKFAATRVCGRQPALQGHRSWRQCRADFTARAVRAFNSIELAEFHASRTTQNRPSATRDRG